MPQYSLESTFPEVQDSAAWTVLAQVLLPEAQVGQVDTSSYSPGICGFVLRVELGLEASVRESYFCFAAWLTVLSCS